MCQFSNNLIELSLPLPSGSSSEMKLPISDMIDNTLNNDRG